MLKKIKSLLGTSIDNDSNTKEEEFKVETEDVKNKIRLLLEKKFNNNIKGINN